MITLTSALKALGKGLGFLTAALFLALLAYTGIALWAWGDIAPETISQRYPVADLRIATVDGVPFRYQLSGPEDQPAVVLIHNHFMDLSMWDAWTQALADHHRVLRFDLSGHGRTGPDPSNIYTVERDAALLNQLMNQLEIPSAHIVGSSLGGNVAYTLAAQYPQRVLSLALINSGGMPRENNRAEGTIPPIADAIFPLVPPLAYRKFLNWMTVDHSHITPAVEQRFVDMFRREGNRGAELERLRQYDPADCRPVLATITAPSLVLWGADNPQLPATLAQQFGQALRNSEQVAVHVIAGAGHVLPLEKPTQSLTIYRSFLENLPTSTGAPP